MSTVFTLEADLKKLEANSGDTILVRADDPQSFMAAASKALEELAKATGAQVMVLPRDIQVDTGQETIDRILERARRGRFGIREEPAENKYPNMAMYGGTFNQSAAQALVGAFHAKYDLISVFEAMLDEVMGLPMPEPREEGGV